MSMRRFSSVSTLLIAAAALLGACSQHMESGGYGAPPPPAAPPSQPVLMGGPTAAQTSAQAADDAYISSLPAGLMAIHKTDPSTGRTILVISNYPVPNPTWHGGARHPGRHHFHLYGAPHGRSVTTAQISGTVTATSTAATTAPSTTTTTTSTVATTAPVKAAPPVQTARASSAPAAVAPVDKPATQASGFTLSPGMWLIGGLVLLAIIVLIMLAGRKPKRRSYERESLVTPSSHEPKAPELSHSGPVPEPDHTPDPVHA